MKALAVTGYLCLFLTVAERAATVVEKYQPAVVDLDGGSEPQWWKHSAVFRLSYDMPRLSHRPLARCGARTPACRVETRLDACVGLNRLFKTSASNEVVLWKL